MDTQVVSLYEQSGALVVKFEGAARVEAAETLRQRLLNVAPDKALSIDWAGAEHIDACVLQVLLAARKPQARGGLCMQVVKDNARIRGYLQLAGLAEYFPLQTDVSSVAPLKERRG